MGYLIDGEDQGAWSMDLLLGAGQALSVDDDAATVELAVLERGKNSDFVVRGILVDRSLTDAIFVGRGSLGGAGWSMNTLEIEDTQAVGGVGISLGQEWDGAIGVRIEALSSYNGPDIVAVGVAVPGPGAAGVLAAGAVVVGRRRRKGM
jgi:hypothetical protein